MPAVRTVLGDVAAAELGVCDAHDHLFFRSAQLAGQELDDADAAVGELRAFAALGGRAVVQWTPFGLGRRADLLAGVSQANHATDWRLHECLADLVRHGHEDQILIGGDTTTAAARSSTGGGPGLPYLLRVLRPRLAAELGEEVAAKFFIANPARAFSWA